MTAAGVWSRCHLALLAVCTAAVVAVEAVLVEPGHLLEAQIADALLVLLIVNLGPRDGSGLTRRAAASILALRALALVPLIRVVSLGMPLGELSKSTTILLVAIAFGVAVCIAAPALDIRRARFVAMPLTPSGLLPVVAGLPLGWLVYVAGGDALWPRDATSPEIAAAIAAAACAAVTEELVFRGAVQLTYERVAGALGAVVATGLFAATYLGAGSTGLVLAFALAGLVFSYSVARTGALGGAIAGHVLLALSAGALWPHVLGRTPAVDLDGTPGTVLWAAIVLGVALMLATGRGGQGKG